MAPKLKQDLLAGVGVLTLAEFGDVNVAAAILDVSTSYLNKSRLTGDGPPFVKFGAAVRYHIPTLRAWAEAKTFHSTSEYCGAA